MLSALTHVRFAIRSGRFVALLGLAACSLLQAGCDVLVERLTLDCS
ncbi:hypothetical protein BAC2_01154 [uncultured bacterium]|nr:hypothetical protein BAC2_01154 [uncultured bacterium]